MERQIGAVERGETYLSFVCIVIVTPIGVFEYPFFLLHYYSASHCIAALLMQNYYVFPTLANCIKMLIRCF